jgi:hypothetical protein
MSAMVNAGRQLGSKGPFVPLFAAYTLGTTLLVALGLVSALNSFEPSVHGLVHAGQRGGGHIA